MLVPLMLIMAVAGSAPDTTPPTTAPTGRALWLFQPLFPRQEAFIPRIEEAIGQLFSPQDRTSQIIGRSDLVKRLRGKAVDLDCVFKDAPCSDPKALLMKELGLDRVVLVKGGQDESLYRFKVLNIERQGGQGSISESSDVRFDKALRAALLKSVPLTATLVVMTSPPGASVFVDDELIGVTPLAPTQLLAGVRTVRIELSFHNSLEVSRRITVGETVRLSSILTILGLSYKSWGWAWLGVGALAGGTGVTLGVQASRQASYTREIPQTRDRDYEQAVSSARETARLADGLYLGAMVASGLGAWLVLSSASTEQAMEKELQLLKVGFAPLPQGGAVSVGGSF